MLNTRGLSILLLVLLAVPLVGCGGGAGTIAVTGLVTHNSSPLADADVSFIPESGRPAYGRTDSSGRFTLTTFEQGDGAMPGKHTVTIMKSEELKAATDANPYAEYRSVLPEKYGRPQESPLTAEVEKGGSNDFTFDVTN